MNLAFDRRTEGCNLKLKVRWQQLPGLYCCITVLLSCTLSRASTVYGALESIPRNVPWRAAYNNPIPTRFLASIVCLKIPALNNLVLGTGRMGQASLLFAVGK